jgi:hypothetical protein
VTPPARGASTRGEPWGALVNNQWSFAGWGKDEFNELLLQPFLNYNFGEGWYITSAAILRQTGRPRRAMSDRAARLRWRQDVTAARPARWRQPGDLRKLPVNASLPAYANAVRPEFADWQLCFQIKLLFPK